MIRVGRGVNNLLPVYRPAIFNKFDFIKLRIITLKDFNIVGESVVLWNLLNRDNLWGCEGGHVASENIV